MWKFIMHICSAGFTNGLAGLLKAMSCFLISIKMKWEINIIVKFASQIGQNV